MSVLADLRAELREAKQEQREANAKVMRLDRVISLYTEGEVEQASASKSRGPMNGRTVDLEKPLWAPRVERMLGFMNKAPEATYSQKQVCDGTDLPQNQVSVMVSTLLSKGMIEKVGDWKHGRTKPMRLTQKAKVRATAIEAGRGIRT